MTHRSHPALIVTAIAAAALLGACNRSDHQTAGQKVDQAVDTTKQAATDAKNDVSNMASDVKNSTSKAATSIADTTRDIAITAKVKTALAKDSDLSAMSINVDTSDGRVALNGTAPDVTSRERATSLAAGVEGVKSVDNRLSIKSKTNG